MPRLFHWGRREHHFRDFDRPRRFRDEHHGPEFPFPPLPFDLESDVYEDEYQPGEEEAETRHRHRRRWSRNQDDQEFDEGEDISAPTNMEAEPRGQSGRWVRHRHGIVLYGV
jgi:hypothetical protein